MDMKLHWIFIIALAILTSCGKQIPSHVLKPEQMEDVLYDYHLAMGMFGNKHLIENHQRNAFMNYIYDKHKITSAEFDSSMVWYTREALELCAIYERLEKRFKREHNHAENLLSNRKEENTMTTSYGDTVDIWRKRDIYWMSNGTLNNKLAFEFKTDTNFHAKDAFRWNMDIHFLTPGELTLGLNVIYDNDSVIGKTRKVDESGNQEIYLHTDSAYQIKELNGFIYVKNDSIKDLRILIKNISLMRYHMQEEDTLTTRPVSKP